MSGLTLALFLAAQAPPVAEPGTEVRALTVSFLDSKDGEVAELSPSDVALSENGVAREIISFKRDSRPLSVVVLVDSSAGLGSAFRLNVVDAVSGFVSRLPLGTRYTLWTTGERPTKILDFTEDKEAAARALRMVAPQGGNYMLDGLAEASADLKKLAREGDRTAVVAVTASGRELSYRDKFRAVEDAQNNADLFLSVEMDEGASDDDFDSRANLSYVLDRLAVSSGGRYLVVISAMGADTGLRKLSTVLRAGYRIAYATVPDLKRRKLELKVARPGTKVLVPAPTPPRS
ncbi:MAG TPA: VWA domain-containing protein [Vicinamibacteria bacterium]|nr:VWA domain-containing protein [Vicinamibacteria bacterium]